jgi:hypothetical protein
LRSNQAEKQRIALLACFCFIASGLRSKKQSKAFCYARISACCFARISAKAFLLRAPSASEAKKARGDGLRPLAFIAFGVLLLI